MSKHDHVLKAPTPDEVNVALERIVNSEPFRASPQLVSFLCFVVEAVLRGEADRIKGYTIGVEVLRRDVNFDPQLDPIVRVEATRLRRALERYYSGPGANDGVVIELPRGSYAPVFSHRSEILDNPDARSGPRFNVMRIALAALSLLAVAVSIAGWVGFLNHNNTPGSKNDQLRSEYLQPGNGMPTLVVQNFETIGQPNPNIPFARTMFEKLRNALSRFDAINIGTQGSQSKGNYQLRGFIEYLGDEGMNVRFSLLDVEDGNIVWTRNFDKLLFTKNLSAIEDSVAADVASTLLQPFGLIRSRERAKYLADDRHGDPRYRCLLLTADAFRSFDPSEDARARTCLEHFIEVDPGFADGYSYLAIVFNREWIFGFGKAANDPLALDTALKLARRGVELHPDNARAWEVLSAILFTRRDTTGAIAASQKAVMLNPYDVIIATDYGGRLITVGKIDEGMKILEDIPTSGGVRPSWEHFYLFLANYMRGKLPDAMHEADQMTSETYSFGLFARALMAATNGNRDKSQFYWNRLITLRSAWHDNPREELGRFISSPLILDRLMQGLATSGLLVQK